MDSPPPPQPPPAGLSLYELGTLSTPSPPAQCTPCPPFPSPRASFPSLSTYAPGVPLSAALALPDALRPFATVPCTPVPLPALTPLPAPSPSLLWMDTGVAWAQLADAAASPPLYEYTVTGARRRVPAATSAAAAAEERPATGVRVHLNGVDVAIFRYGAQPLAFQATCPHAGGALELGDIEDFNGQLCVCCPRHGFLFACQGSGVSIAPPDRYSIATYASRVAAHGAVQVGFTKIHAALFRDPDF